MDGVQVRHLPDAGHMLPLTHAAASTPRSSAHIALVDELAAAPAAGRRTAERAGRDLLLTRLLYATGIHFACNALAALTTAIWYP